MGRNVETDSTYRELDDPSELAADGDDRPGAVTTAGVLLLMHSVALLILGGVHLAAFYFPEVEQFKQFFPGYQRRVMMSLVVIPLAVLVMASALGLLRMRRYSWLLSIFGQGVALALSLFLYFTDKPWYAYLLMVDSIGLVFLLNYHDVQDPFRRKIILDGEPVDEIA